MTKRIVSSWYKDKGAVKKLKELAGEKNLYAQFDYAGICIEKGKNIEENYAFLEESKNITADAKEFALFNLAVLSYENGEMQKSCEYLRKIDWKLCPFALLMLIFICLQQKENLSEKEVADCKKYLLTFLDMYDRRGMEDLRLTCAVIYLTQNAPLAEKLLFDFFGIKSDVEIKSKEISKKNKFPRAKMPGAKDLNFRRKVMENIWNSVLEMGKDFIQAGVKVNCTKK